MKRYLIKTSFNNHSREIKAEGMTHLLEMIMGGLFSFKIDLITSITEL